MKIIDISDIKDDLLFQRNDWLDGISFMDMERCNDVLIACDSDVSVLRDWFDIIGIKYDSINIVTGIIVYTVNNICLNINDLSSGERYLLYLFAAKRLNKKLVVSGLFERMGSRLERVVLEQLSDYGNLLIVKYNALLPKEFQPFIIKEVQAWSQ